MAFRPASSIPDVFVEMRWARRGAWLELLWPTRLTLIVR